MNASEKITYIECEASHALCHIFIISRKISCTYHWGRNSFYVCKIWVGFPHARLIHILHEIPSTCKSLFFIECILTQILLRCKSFHFNPHFLLFTILYITEFIVNHLSSRWYENDYKYKHDLLLKKLFGDYLPFLSYGKFKGGF